MLIVDALFSIAGKNENIRPGYLQKITSAKKSYTMYLENFLSLAETLKHDKTITPQSANQMMIPLKKHIS